MTGGGTARAPDNKFSMFSCYLQTARINLIPQEVLNTYYASGGIAGKKNLCPSYFKFLRKEGMTLWFSHSTRCLKNRKVQVGVEVWIILFLNVSRPLRPKTWRSYEISSEELTCQTLSSRVRTFRFITWAVHNCVIITSLNFINWKCISFNCKKWFFFHQDYMHKTFVVLMLTF